MNSKAKAREADPEMSDKYEHETVLPDVTMEHLNIREDGTYIDCTAGGGGHSARILERLNKDGMLVAMDRDAEAVEATKKRLSDMKVSGKYTVIKENFVNIDKIIDEYAPGGADGILMDLGVSSWQLDDAARGFSYHSEAKLDMRMDKNEELTAFDVVNGYSREHLITIIRKYGEERYAGRIANAITRKRSEKPIETTTELAEIIKYAYPPKDRFKGGHPARRTFQAIRIEVNKELENLEEALQKAAERLAPGGRLAVISFHSLEDRIVKVTFSKLENPCICPPYFPVCVCKRVGGHKVISKKPITPASEEIDDNRRSRSSKLRIIERNTT